MTARKRLDSLRERFATVSSGAADEATGSGRARGGGIANKAVFRDGWGMFVNPFSAHSYIGFEKELSHATLAQRGAPSVERANLPVRLFYSFESFMCYMKELMAILRTRALTFLRTAVGRAVEERARSSKRPA